MVKTKIANTALAVISFLMTQYFGTDCGDWLMTMLAHPLRHYLPISK